MPNTHKLQRFFSKTKTQISVLYAAGSLFVLLIFSFVMYQSISLEYVQNAILSVQDDIEQSSAGISLYIDNVKTLSDLLAHNEETIAFLTNPEIQDTQNLLEQMDLILANDPYVQSIFLVSRDGRILADSLGARSNDLAENFSTTWYQSAIANDMPTLAGANMRTFTVDNDSWVVSLNHSIYNKDGENIGVLVMDLRYSFIEELIVPNALGTQGYLYILDEKEQLVYHPDVSYFTDLEKQTELLEMSDMPLGYHPEKNMVSYQVPVLGTNWTLLCVSSLDGLQDLQVNLLELVVLTSFLILSGSILVGLYFASRISRPLARLANHMQSMKPYHDFEKTTHSGSEEIRSLSQNYNEMLLHMQSLLEQLSQKEKSLKEFEIRALIGQINPHFLYNTLDTIVWMAEFEENDKVIDTTKSLAKFFRISLSGGRDYIPLKQEVEHVRQYLFLQKQRYGEKLNYEIYLQEGLEEILVPKIILQPLVENSIYHGIKPLDRPGLIRIVCQKQNDSIMLCIYDDGIGFDTQCTVSKDHLRLSGIGLENVRARLRLYFGQEADLLIASQKEKETKVCIIFESKETKVP